MSIDMLVAALAAFILGITKGGIKGLGILIVTLMALVYGAKSSTGILVPLLICGDILAVIYFKKHTKWEHLVHFLPWMLVGVVVAVVVGKDLPEAVFKNWMAGIILFCVGFLFWSESRVLTAVPKKWWFASSIGFSAGFTTMIGNLAGPFANLFFLATRMPKNEIIGTAAWVFFIVNIFKVPFHVFSWKTITWETLLINVYLLPFVIIGFFVGVKMVDLFSEKQYRKFLLLVTALGAVLIFLK